MLNVSFLISSPLWGELFMYYPLSFIFSYYLLSPEGRGLR
jgi:hypothetical protein